MIECLYELIFYMQKGNAFWNNLDSAESPLFPWDAKSTYISCPSFFSKLVSVQLIQILPKTTAPVLTGLFSLSV